MKILLLIPALGWLVISGILFAAGEFSSKEFALSPGWFWATIAIAFYTVGAAAWLPAILQKQELSTTGALWSVIALLTTVGIGLLIFHERPGVYGYLGIAFGLVAVFLLSL